MTLFTKYEDQGDQPFLDKSDKNEKNFDQSVCTCNDHRNRGAKHTSLLLWTIVVLAMVFIVAFLGVPHFVSRASFGQHYSSPLGPLNYEKKLLGSPMKDNPFVGEPGPEVDQAWADLLQNAQIRVSASEVAQTYQQTSIPLRDGSGYIAELGVYHYLHCLKMIKQNLNLDHYHPEYTDFDNHRQVFHISHCIELLREAIMCNADTSIMTFRWVKQYPIPVTHLWSTHECVNWDMVESWADKRRVNISQPGLIGPNPDFPEVED